MTSPKYERYACGPLEILVAAETETLRAKIADVLDLYNVEWPEPLCRRRIEIRESDAPAALRNGDYLLCARMNVDFVGEELIATCPSGPQAVRDADGHRWTIIVPRCSSDPWVLTDIESLLSLVLTEGWRDEGWVPVHAATAVFNDRCAIICAESGGGKTSLTAALIRRGWRTLGDDKLLLRITEDGTPELSGLVHTFNLHPRTQSWFPEVGELEQLPVYSDWTEKRKVRPESIWPGCTLKSAVPTDLFHIARVRGESPLVIAPLESDSVLSILLHQTVVPTHASTARQILGTVARTARTLTGFRIDIGEDAYLDPECLSVLEKAVSSTLTSAAV